MTGSIKARHSSLLHVEKLARNQNDLVRSANRRRWLGLDGAIFQAAIRVVDCCVSICDSSSPDALGF